jgi:hypothetical protein
MFAGEEGGIDGSELDSTVGGATAAGELADGSVGTAVGGAIGGTERGGGVVAMGEGAGAGDGSIEGMEPSEGVGRGISEGSGAGMASSEMAIAPSASDSDSWADGTGKNSNSPWSASERKNMGRISQRTGMGKGFNTEVMESRD